jgi:DNA end-binding protein Ku
MELIMAMRSMRKMVLTWCALVSVPLKVYKATDDKEIGFRQVHLADGGRVRQPKKCEACDEYVEQTEIGKGYEVTPDNIIPLSEDDMKTLPLKSSSELAVDKFVMAEEIDPLWMSGKHYFLGPDKGGDKGYALLADTLAKANRYAVTKTAFSGRERMAVIRSVDGVLVMSSLSWPDELRNREEVPFSSTPKVGEDESELALQLVEVLSGTYNPADYKDEYATALKALVERKTSDPDAPAPAIEAAPEQPEMAVKDALAAALAAAKASK